jgi:late competence protein required for DNA uptake (superfamily II DNA/RNA helicase)
MNPFAAKQEKFYCAKCGKRLEWLSEQIFFEGKFYCVSCFEISKTKFKM